MSGADVVVLATEWRRVRRAGPEGARADRARAQRHRRAQRPRPRCLACRGLDLPGPRAVVRHRQPAGRLTPPWVRPRDRPGREDPARRSRGIRLAGVGAVLVLVTAYGTRPVHPPPPSGATLPAANDPNQRTEHLEPVPARAAGPSGGGDRPPAPHRPEVAHGTPISACPQTGVERPFGHSLMASSTLSVILEMVCRDTWRRGPRPDAPDSPCAWTSPVVNPFADSEMTSSSTPARRFCRLAMILGSKLASGSRGTSTSTGRHRSAWGHGPVTVLGALDRCCEHGGLSLVRRAFRAGSAGVEIVAHGHGVRRDGCRGLQAEATPAIAATEDSHALLGIVVVEDARRSGPPAGAGQAAFDPDPRTSTNVAHVVGAVPRGE